MKRAVVLLVVAVVALTGLGACTTDADVVNRNITQEADNFNIVRRIVFFNGITDTYLLEVTGRCSITDAGGQLEVLCRRDDGYVKHFLGLSDNVSYFAEQVQVADVNANFYQVTFKPSVIIPDIEIR